MSAPHPLHPFWRPGLTFSVQEGAEQEASGAHQGEIKEWALGWLCQWQPQSQA